MAGPRRLVFAGVLVVVAASALLLGVLVSASVWAVLVPLLFVVSSVGLIMPNAIALALAGHERAAGTAAALLGLVHFGIGALVPPLASGLGVTPLVMAATILGTSLAAALALGSARHALV